MLARTFALFLPNDPLALWRRAATSGHPPSHCMSLVLSIGVPSGGHWDGVKAKNCLSLAGERHDTGELPTQATWTGDTAKAGCLGGRDLVATSRSVSIKTQTLIQAASSSAGSRRDRKMAGTTGSRAHYGSASAILCTVFSAPDPHSSLMLQLARLVASEIHDSVLPEAMWRPSVYTVWKYIWIPWQGSHSGAKGAKTKKFHPFFVV